MFAFHRHEPKHELVIMFAFHRHEKNGYYEWMTSKGFWNKNNEILKHDLLGDQVCNLTKSIPKIGQAWFEDS
jgi:hypothetical protein